MMDRWKVHVVEAWLKDSGWWFPPDAISAVAEGRDTYHALDPRIAWPTSRCAEPVGRAIERAREAGWNRPKTREPWSA